MIVVYAEVWPDGDQSRARPIGSIGIWNSSMPGELLQTYSYELDEAEPYQRQDKGVVTGHNPKQSVWRLVQRVLQQVHPMVITP